MLLLILNHLSSHDGITDLALSALVAFLNHIVQVVDSMLQTILKCTMQERWVDTSDSLNGLNSILHWYHLHHHLLIP